MSNTTNQDPVVIQHEPKTSYQYMRLPEVMQATGLSRTSIYNFMNRGDFPSQIKISRRYVVWRSDEVQAWLDSWR